MASRKTINLDSDRHEMGLRIWKFRTRKKLTQRQLAMAIRANHSMIGHYESGRNVPSLIMAKRLAVVLGVSLDKLIEGIWE